MFGIVGAEADEGIANEEELFEQDTTCPVDILRQLAGRYQPKEEEEEKRRTLEA